MNGNAWRFLVDQSPVAILVAAVLAVLAAVRGSKWWRLAMLLPLIDATGFLSLAG